MVTFNQTYCDIDWFPICLWLCYSVSNSGDISSNSFWHRLISYLKWLCCSVSNSGDISSNSFWHRRVSYLSATLLFVSNSGDISSNLFWHRMVSYLSVTLLLCQQLWWHFIKLICRDWFPISSDFVTLLATLVTFHQTHSDMDWFPICLWLCCSVSNSGDISLNSFWHRVVSYLFVTLLLCQQLRWHFIKLILT